MKFLLFEWMVGGGLVESESPLDQEDSFFKQGSAMFSAMATDLFNAGHHVLAPLDARVQQSGRLPPWAPEHDHFESRIVQGNLQEVLRDLAAESDQIILIAPESDGILADCYRWLSAFSDHFFGGPLSWIELASDKNSLQPYLAANGIAVPSENIAAGCTWIAKPIRGAGSDDVQVFSTADQKTDFEDRQKWHVEQFVPGKSVSISIVTVSGRHCFLPPTGQIFGQRASNQNASLGSLANQSHSIETCSIGTYTGAEYPLSDDHARRAIALATQTVDVLPEFRGYIGIDMILADAGPDVVIEINPRMTMSYCHLPLDLRRRWLEFFGR